MQALLDDWTALGVTFTDAGQYVHIAPASVNQDLLRLDYMRHVHARPTTEEADRVDKTEEPVRSAHSTPAPALP
ncbi:hypothetical protein ABZ865_34510 [Streptomyces sp. NPDC047085]|uniref:hypothetical protein n=1 Tax=Streptomyces sp. NPDC047085 TaxID=3155140 RepID=UPI0033EB0BF9